MSSEPIPIHWKANDPVRVKAGICRRGEVGVVKHRCPVHRNPVVEFPDGHICAFLDADLEGVDTIAVEITGKQAFAELIAKMPPSPPPTIKDTVQGALSWQQVDPQLRRVSIQITGHVVEVWVTIIPDLSARRIKFLMPYSASETRIMLDDLAHGPAERTAVVVGRETSDDVNTSILDGGD